MRAGASVARVVRDLEERRIKGEARRGSGIAWWKGEVKRNTRCQTGSRSVPGCLGLTPEMRTHVDMLTAGQGVSTDTHTADYRLVCERGCSVRRQGGDRLRWCK
jgi:beta-lactamase superfamily II metal-dependent hydrolase